MAFSEKIKYNVKQKSHQSCCVCKSIGIEIHHIVPQTEDGSDEIDNAAPLCPSCHETYGANPQKRKFIKESRDIWYDICEKRFSLFGKELKNIDQKLNSILKYVESDNNNKEKYLSFGEIVDFLFQFKHPKEQNSNFQFMFNFIYNLDGSDDEESKAFNKLRDSFTELLGSYFAEKVILYLLADTKVNWKKGVTEPELLNFINSPRILWILLMNNPNLELEEDATIGCILREEGELAFVYTGKNPNEIERFKKYIEN